MYYSGHVDLIEVQVFDNGWQPGKEGQHLLRVFHPKIKDLREAIRKVKALK